MLKRIFALILVCIMSIGLLTACGDRANPSSSSGDDEGGSGNEYRDTLKIASPVDAETLDPVTTVDTEDMQILENIVDGLVRASEDGSEILPRLATDWDYDEDALTWTFQLRKDLKFSDGSDVTAEDIEFSFQRCIDHTESMFYPYISQVESVSCPDDTTVKFKMKGPDPTFLTGLCMSNAKVISKAYFDANGGEDGVAHGVLGTGPYAIAEWKKGNFIQLVKNEHYWVDGLPKTENVIFQYVAEAESRALMLQAGEIDIDLQIPLDTMAELDAQEGITAKSTPGARTRYFIINHRHEPFQNLKVRQALRYAINLQEIVDIVMQGEAQVANSYINPAGQFYNKDVPYPEQDIDKAKALLTEAGYPNGFTFDYLVVSGNIETEQIATVVKEQLAQAGINAEIFKTDNATMNEMFSNNGIAFYVSQWSLQSADPAPPSDYWWFYEQSEGFMSGYQNDRLTQINKLAKTEMDEKVRGDYFEEMQQTFYDDVVAIPIFYGNWINAWRDGVSHFVQQPFSYFYLENVTVTD